MKIYLFLAILILLCIIAYCAYRMDTYKANLAYYSTTIDKLRADLDKERIINEQTHKKLYTTAYTNSFTKLGNMDYFFEKTQELFQTPPEEGTKPEYTLICFNIQNIGKINELFGPTEGDNVVLHASKCLDKVGRREKTVYAQIYSNLFGMVVKERSEEYILN